MMTLTSTVLPFLLTIYSFLCESSDAFIQYFVPVVPHIRKGSAHFTPAIRLRASSFVEIARTSSVDVSKASSELQSLLLDRWNGKSESVDTLEKIERIEKIIDQLIQGQVDYDENDCLYGPLYATIYTTGVKTKPLWEQFASLATADKKNISGQKYFKDSNGDGKVINYSEVYGRSFHIRADGNVALRTPLELIEATPKPATPQSPIDSLTSFLNNIGGKNKNMPAPKKLSKCPTDYLATVTKASFNLFGKSLDLPVKGTGIARLLYADPNLRIFVSVTENDWEQTAGLKVVQVRIDLVEEEWEELS